MVNKAKKQGTNYETNIVNRLNKIDNFKAQRFAEGGSNDLGDIQLFIDDEEFFIEAKSRQNLNLHQTLDKAIYKSGDINTLVFWKKLKRKSNNERRSNDGVPEVISMSYELFVKLLEK
jgi:Holliday junction resolvase